MFNVSIIFLLFGSLTHCLCKATTIPNVIISGGGPGGLLTSILLNNIGIRSSVLEEAIEPDEWSSKSYAMSLNERGKDALNRGGCLDSVMQAGNEKKCSYFVDGKTGDIKMIPMAKPSLGVSRPLLVKCIEKIAKDLPHVTLRRGVGVSRVTKDDKGSGGLQVYLEDGTDIPATHIVGADGKWSKVRQSFPSLNSQANLAYCKCFGVLMVCENAVKGWSDNGTYIIVPSEESGSKQDFYIIASTLINGGMSLAMVCTNRISEKYPWLRPEADPNPKDIGDGGWKDETGMEKISDTDLSDNLEKMFQDDVPAFHAILNKDFYKSAKITRRSSWLQMSTEEGKDVSYSTEDGRVTLIGDAAHAMTASMGEGGNCAMESAVKLADAVSLAMKENGETSCTVNTLNEAFLKYGLSRPKEVQPVQEMSAERNNK